MLKSTATSPAEMDPVAGKSVAEIFGEIVWLISQDRIAKDVQVKELEWLVMAPILLKQFHITYAPVPATQQAAGDASTAAPTLQPVAVELFAMCSDIVAAAIDADKNQMLKLTLNDWRSGEHKRIVRRFSPFGKIPDAAYSN